MKNIIFLVVSIFIFTACSKVNVVLLPEEGDKVGKIEIKNKDKTFTVDKAYEQVNAEDGDSSILTKDKVYKKYKASIKSLPKKPISYLLHFKWDSSEIVQTSSKVLKEILVEAKKIQVDYIHIVGHTDRAGDMKYNKKLSLKRATNIKNILIKNGIKKEKVSIDFYGESLPIIKTKDGVAKKINRRVEVILK